MSEIAYQLTYQSLKNAAPVASYAGKVLGVPVYSRNDNGSQYQLFGNGKGGMSKVVAEPYWEETRCQLEVGGSLSNWIDVKCADGRLVQGWDIDCTKINYFQSRTGKIYKLMDIH